jgi:hypothetical protein
MKRKTVPLQNGKLGSLLMQCVSRRERAKHLYKLADAALDHALALGVTLDEPVAVQFRDKKNIVIRKLVVKDLFKDTNTVFKSVSGHRFDVAEYKEPKPPKKIEEEAA